eukprot:8852994-Alexandrium_andersonii.AAC.1
MRTGRRSTPRWTSGWRSAGARQRTASVRRSPTSAGETSRPALWSVWRRRSAGRRPRRSPTSRTSNAPDAAGGQDP